MIMPLFIRPGALVGSALLFAAFACGGESGSGARGSVRDSAGIAIATNTDRGLWSESERPVLREETRIAHAGGDGNYEFSNVVSVDVGSDGSLYVLDQQAQNVRVYGRSGSYLRTVGRRGMGPGELGAQVAAVFESGDTLSVADIGNQRLTFFSAEGTLLGSTPLPYGDGIALKWVERPEGGLVSQMRIFPGLPAGREPADVFVMRDMAGRILDTIMTLPPSDAMKVGDQGFQMTLFAPEQMWTVGEGNAIYFGLNSEYSISVADESGRTRRIVRRAVEHEPVTDEIKEDFRRRLRELYRAQSIPERTIDQLLGNLRFADYYPVIGAILEGPGKTLWVQRLITTRAVKALGPDFNLQDLGSRDWDVHDEEGSFLGTVSMPERFTPLRWAGDLLLGISRDESDVQAVVVLRFES